MSEHNEYAFVKFENKEAIRFDNIEHANCYVAGIRKGFYLGLPLERIHNESEPEIIYEPSASSLIGDSE